MCLGPSQPQLRFRLITCGQDTGRQIVGKNNEAPESTEPQFTDQGDLPLAMQYDYTNFYFGAGDDAFAMLDPFAEWWKDSEPAGYYLYGLPRHEERGDPP